MLAVQAVVNAAVFGFLALSAGWDGSFGLHFWTSAVFAILFAVSAFGMKALGRPFLVTIWFAALCMIPPQTMVGGLMDGGLLVIPVSLYLIAGLIGACFLPVRDSPTPGAPP